MHRVILEEFRKCGSFKRRTLNRTWNKNSEYRCYGVSSKDLQALERKYRGIVKALPFGARLKLAKALGAAKVSEAVQFGNWVLSLSTGEMTPVNLPFLNRYGECFTGWGDVDDFCMKVLQPLLLRFPNRIIEMLRRWNCSRNVWKRRGSVVAFTRKIGAKGEFAEVALELCDRLIFDPNDLVKKAVGWALKDTMSGAEQKTIPYVQGLRRKGVSSTITLYAMRGLPVKKRKALLRIKKVA